MRIKNLFVLLTLIIGIYACKKDKIVPVKVVVNNDVKFSTEIYPIFAKYTCTGCHPPSAGLDYTKTSSEIITDLKSVGAVVPNDVANSKFYTNFENGTSHYGKTLTTQESANIESWIEQGAQDN